MFRTLALVVLCCLIQACSVPLKVEEYKYEDKHIAEFDLKGNLAVTSGKPSSEQIKVYSHRGMSITSDLNSLTDIMVRQTIDQAKKRGRVKAGGSAKSIELKILSILSEQSFYHTNSKMSYQVKLGNGDSFTKGVEHSSMNAHQDLTGCIADGVIALLQDEKVKAYLAQ